MAVYVGPVVKYPRKMIAPQAQGLGQRWCHMVTDGDLEELHGMAEKVGLARSWFQRGSVPHYDLTPAKRKQAIRAGAVPVTNREMVEKLRKHKQRRLF